MVSEIRTETDDRMVRDPRVMAGKPVIRGTRIQVAVILEQLAFNLDLDDLFGAYPELTPDDVKACLSYVQGLVERERADMAISPEASRASA